jgi:ABC-2 type transport system permease protein
VLKILRAFAWLRWRMVINAFDKTGARDKLERFSLAIEQIGPILAIVLVLPTAALLGGLGIYVGQSLARGEASGLTPPAAPMVIAVLAVRYMLFAVPILAVLGPFFLPAADRTNPVRLLLLPIPRSALYVAQSSSAFGDPWNVLAIPLLLGLVVGLTIGGAAVAGVLSLLAALCLVLVLVGLSSLAASLLHLVVRDRRRGELIALLLIVVLPAVGMVPAMLGSAARRHRTTAPAARERRISPVVERVRATAMAVAPTEMFLATARRSSQGDTTSAVRALGSLAAMGVLVHLVGFVAFRKVLESPGSSSGRRGRPMRDLWTWRLPGLSPPASAVALAQLRLALRTPRGRSILLSPLIVFLLFGSMMYRNAGTADMGPFHFTTGIGLATVCSFFSILSVLPIAMNQFAIDRAGLTLALLSPLREQELLAGKAVGNALIVAPTALVCMMISAAMFPGDPVSLWIALLLGLVAMYLIASPIAAIASAMFPRVANLNSIGRAGNPHGLANFVGMLSLVAGGGIPLLLALLSTKLLERPSLAPLLVGAWCLVAAIIARILFAPAVRIFHSRRENLALLE